MDRDGTKKSLLEKNRFRFMTKEEEEEDDAEIEELNAFAEGALEEMVQKMESGELLLLQNPAVIRTAPAEQVEEAPAEQVEEAPAEHVEEAPAEHVEEAPAEHVEEAPAEHVEEAPAEQVEEGTDVHRHHCAPKRANDGTLQEPPHSMSLRLRRRGAVERAATNGNVVSVNPKRSEAAKRMWQKRKERMQQEN